MSLTKWGKNNANDLKYETNKDVFDFQQFQTIRSFGDSTFNDEAIY